MAYEQGEIIVPVINLNGTSADSLLTELHVVSSLLSGAIEAARNLTVHGRDFQTEPRGMYEKARAQHIARIQALQKVFDEWTAIRVAVHEQRAARGGR